MIIAVRTPPYNSWKDQAERIMSILNIAIQGVRLAREKMSDQTEQQLLDCSSMKQIRAQANRAPGIREEVLDSVAQVKVLLGSLSMPKNPLLKKKSNRYGVKFCVLMIHLREATQPRKQSRTKKAIKDKEKLQKFLESHCRETHYAFSVKKCGSQSCNVCKPPQLPPSVFETLQHCQTLHQEMVTTRALMSCMGCQLLKPTGLHFRRL